MDLSTSLTGSQEFQIVKRGYDPDQVNAFLDQVAHGVTELRRKLAEAETQAGLQHPGAASVHTAEAEEIQRALILAQRAADEELRSAQSKAEQLVTDAERRAAEVRAQADVEISRSRDDAKANLLAELAELEGQRDALANDVVVLERHVEEQREVVQAAISELQSLLDHPEAFRIGVVTDLTTKSGSSVPFLKDGSSVADEVTDEVPVANPDQGSLLDDAPAVVANEASVLVPAPMVEEVGGPRDDSDLGGPPTQAMDSLPDDGDDEFLTELRKAALDDEPLGPRDNAGDGVFELDVSEKRGRFGRRR